MCKPAKGSELVNQRFILGSVYSDGKYILLSEGKSTEGGYYCLWVRSNPSPLCSIEYITEKESGRGHQYKYTRKFSCDILECAAETYLKLLNPNSPYKLK